MQPTLLETHWWSLALRGAIALAFGAATLLWPSLGLMALTALFGAYAFFDGILCLGVLVDAEKVSIPRWALGIIGVAGLAAGVATLMWPAITVMVLLALIAIHALVVGAVEIGAAFALRQELENAWALGLAGLASFAFGALMLSFPGAGALAVAWLIGAYALVVGAILVGMGLQLRQQQARQPRVRITMAPSKTLSEHNVELRERQPGEPTPRP